MAQKGRMGEVTMQKEIMPCPFCGGDPTIKFLKRYPGAINRVECSKCGARTRKFVAGDTVDSVWNVRAEGSVVGVKQHEQCQV